MGALSDDAAQRLTSVCLTFVCVSVVYIGDNSRTERPRKTKIGKQGAHVTRDSDTTFRVKRSTFRGVALQRPAYSGRGHIVSPRAQLLFVNKTTRENYKHVISTWTLHARLDERTYGSLITVSDTINYTKYITACTVVQAVVFISHWPK